MQKLEKEIFQAFNDLVPFLGDEIIDSVTIRADGTVISERAVETTCAMFSDALAILRDIGLSTVTIRADGTLTFSADDSARTKGAAQ